MANKSNKLEVGCQVIIPEGTKVTTRGNTTRRENPAIVTVRQLEYTRAGNPKVTWKSAGYAATAILKVAA